MINEQTVATALRDATNLETDGRGWSDIDNATELLVREAKESDSFSTIASTVARLRETIGKHVLASLMHTLAEFDNDSAAWAATLCFGRILEVTGWDGVGEFREVAKRGNDELRDRIPGLRNTGMLVGITWSDRVLVDVLKHARARDVWTERASLHLTAGWCSMNCVIPPEVRELTDNRDFHTDLACRKLLIRIDEMICLQVDGKGEKPH